ncbi:MAG: aminotransferase class IV [Candidatus Gracilibacteria bacterium]|jgi:branched-subunit amino acid aminotransferase/4-amino-4-deoxychorismate lyase
MFVFLNGEILPEKAAMISIDDEGFRFGGGFFETVLLREGKPQNLAAHLRRLRDSAKILDSKIPYAVGTIEAAVAKLVMKNKIGKGMLRITLTPQTFLMVTLKFPKRPKEASACFVKMERCLPQLKTLNYLPTVLAQREAATKGFEEALLVDRKGFVTEGGRTNLFWVKNKKVFTPPLGDALAGTTRARVITLIQEANLKFAESKVKPEKLLLAEEVFLTNAPMEIWPVTKIENKHFPLGEITQLLQEAYAEKYE